MHMIYRCTKRSLLVLAVLSFVLPGRTFGEEGAAKPLVTAKIIAIVTGTNNTGPELKAAEIMCRRILKRSAITVSVVSENVAAPGADITFVVGMPESNALSKKLVKEFGAVLPTLPGSTKLHPEGFAVKSGVMDGKNYVVIAGTDERGTLYGVGRMLRAMTYLPDAVVVPNVNATDKPAFPIRAGNPSGPGSRATQYGNLRPQTAEEHVETMEDQMLLGTNVFGGDPKQMKATYGMDTSFGRTANEMPPDFKIPKEWEADGHSMRYVCPSVPEARKALLESFDTFFKEAPDYTYFTTNSGDEGGCRCDKCEPWGSTYIKLLHEIADILHKYHPNCKIQATNQDLTPEGNLAIFDYLNGQDASWLFALRYGPGADEMQTYIRGPVNPRWFEYEGFGPLGNYLKYMWHELPRTTSIVLYSDITHWMQAQYAVPKPDVALAAVYDRRSWNARPRNFYKVGQEILHYAIGDMHYSEGMHDDFNKWFWYQTLWNPYQSAETITNEYCRYWFGSEAAPEVAQAIFVMEETLGMPVIDNPGIPKAVDILRSAGKKIPQNLLQNDWRWRVMLGKALMDRYIQLQLAQGNKLKQEATGILTSAETSPQPIVEVQNALKILDQPLETDAMKQVREEAERLGEESNKVIGYREPAPFLVSRFDLTEVGWWKKTLRDAIAASSDTAKIRNAAKMVVHYTEPGEGGFYEDPGWPNESPHLKQGFTLWTFDPPFGPSRFSAYNCAYMDRATGGGLVFAYEGLDPSAQYVVRFSAGRKLVEGSDFPRQPLSQVVEADGKAISDAIPISMEETNLYEFDIPKELTQDGQVRISLVGQSATRPIATVNDIWLLRKDKMPWSAR